MNKIIGYLEPTRNALAKCSRALEQNQREIEKLVTAAINAPGALYDLLAKKANQLRADRERLRVEQRRLEDSLSSLSIPFRPEDLVRALRNFTELKGEAEPEELQRLLRLTVRHLYWMPNGQHRVQYYFLLTTRGQRNTLILQEAPKITGSRQASRRQA